MEQLGKLTKSVSPVKAMNSIIKLVNLAMVSCIYYIHTHTHIYTEEAHRQSIAQHATDAIRLKQRCNRP